MRLKKSSLIFVFLFSAISWPSAQWSAMAAPTYFDATGSWYDVVLTSSETWTSARTAAAATSFLELPGRLATITSQAENDFVLSLIPVSAPQGFWIGGFQTGGPEPSGGWRWITDEPWDWTNWDVGEPNNAAGAENFLEMYGWPGPGGVGKWNDNRDDQTYWTSGYVIEYAPVPEPCSFALVGLGAAALMISRRRK
jgi:hypothetical protein